MKLSRHHVPPRCYKDPKMFEIRVSRLRHRAYHDLLGIPGIARTGTAHSWRTACRLPSEALAGAPRAGFRAFVFRNRDSRWLRAETARRMVDAPRRQTTLTALLQRVANLSGNLPIPRRALCKMPSPSFFMETKCYIIRETKKITRPKATNMAEMIQKRIVTCDSGQPSASKW